MASITVPDVTPNTQIVAIAAQVLFAFTFPVLIDDEASIETFVDGVLQTSGVTVNLLADPSFGGNVTFSVAPGVDTVITIVRTIDIDRLINLTDSGDWTADNINLEFNNLTMIAQQLAKDIGLSIRISDTAPAAVSVVLPDPEANFLLGWDPTGLFIINVDTADDSAASAAASASAAAASASAASADASAAEAALVALSVGNLIFNQQVFS